jgi:hypothetical protein
VTVDADGKILNHRLHRYTQILKSVDVGLSRRYGRAGPPWPAHLSPSTFAEASADRTARDDNEKNLNRKAAKVAKERKVIVFMNEEVVGILISAFQFFSVSAFTS